MARTIKKVLVANRGEIAVRILRCLSELGIPSVAVYSSADADALHVRLAGEAVWIGEPHPLESYLDVEALLKAARDTGADAVHPGYGFLAESAEFARRVEEAGLVFIGPPAAAIRLMGDKVASRRTMAALEIPVMPGSDGPVEAGRGLSEEAARIGYPLLVKASAGGGGKGMRLVRDGTELVAAVESCARESRKAFGDGTVFLERRLENPRHVEFQILGDAHGNFIHLHERECSIQRRNQKLVEETPCTVLDEDLRAAMGRTAVEAARAAGAAGATTVEFLLDGDGRYFFLEMNTRIQVEHPVTEEVTGVDLVAAQIRVAAGEALGLTQEDVTRRGHAIECRIYAEDPAKGFAPSPGRILLFKEPSGPGVRVDTGVETGSSVPVEYDPILAKVVCLGPDRASAIGRMVQALRSLVVFGVSTTAPFLAEVVGHPAFVAGATHTGFLDAHFPTWDDPPGPRFLEALAAAAALAMRGRLGVGARARNFDPWKDLGTWELGRR